MWYATSKKELDFDKVLHAFHQYIEFDGVEINRKDYEKNLSMKIKNSYFLVSKMSLNFSYQKTELF